MKVFKLSIRCENAAFDGRGRFREVARLLKSAAVRVEQGEGDGHLRDLNGNTVGEWSFVHEREDTDPRNIGERR